MASRPIDERWPELPYAAWKDTRDTLHLWTQIVGKIRLALTPWLNHSWHVALYVTARGLDHLADSVGAAAASRSTSTSSITCCGCAPATAISARSCCKPMPVAEFYADVMIALGELGHRRRASTRCRARSPMRFRSSRTRAHAAYDADYANRFWRVLLSAQRRVRRISAPAFSARRARCISSGAASIWR